jgi:hypothetical protein
VLGEGFVPPVTFLMKDDAALFEVVLGLHKIALVVIDETQIAIRKGLTHHIVVGLIDF